MAVGRVRSTRLLHTAIAFILFSVLLLFVCFVAIQFVSMAIFLAIGILCLVKYLVDEALGSELDVIIDTCKQHTAVPSWNNMPRRAHACKVFVIRLPPSDAFTVANNILQYPGAGLLSTVGDQTLRGTKGADSYKV